MTVRVDPRTAREPDALVHRGPRLSANDVIVPAPVIVVEVLSPSTGFYDRHGEGAHEDECPHGNPKLAGSFAVPSLPHHLVVDIDGPPAVHHARDGDEIRTRLVPSGPLRLDPPGLDLDAAALLADG